jgi:hypothetical protein
MKGAIMSVKRNLSVFLALWGLCTLPIEVFNANLLGSAFLGGIIAGFLSWMLLREEKGDEFIVDDLVYNTASARVVAQGTPRSKFLKANWGVAAWGKSQVTFYQTKKGAFFSVERTHILSMVLFFPIPGNHEHARCIAHQSGKQCMAAMVNPEYGGLSPKEASRATGVTLEVA